VVKPSLADALIPMLTLVMSIGGALALFGLDAWRGRSRSRWCCA
jgi:hypothetical protein